MWELKALIVCTIITLAANSVIIWIAEQIEEMKKK